MSKKVVILLLAMVGFAGARAQETDTARVQFGMSVGSTAYVGMGRSQLLSWAVPHVKWRSSERLTVRGGMAVAGSLLPQGYQLHGLGPRSLAPRRQGTQIGAVWAEADYQVNERLWVWGSIAHLSGYVQPLWLDGAVPIAATAISGGVAYAFSDRSLLELHFHFVHDHYGTVMAGPLAHPWYGGFAPNWEIYSGPWPF